MRVWLAKRGQADMTETPDSGPARSLQDMARAAFARDPSLPIIEFEQALVHLGRATPRRGAAQRR